MTLKPPTSSSAAEEGTLVVESSSEVSLPSASANVVPETTITFSRQDSESGSREPHPGATGREAAPVDATMAFHPGHVPEPSDATMQLQRGSSEGDAASVDMSAADIDATDFSLDDGTTRRSPRYVQDATVGFLFADEVESARENEAGRGERAESDRSKEFVPGYELLGELGRGGMGVVYKARHKRLNRVVALKMVLSGGHASAAELARFLTEAEAVAALQHPNIVQIHEIGRHNGLPYFTLEFMDGGSLTDRVKEHPLPPREAARIVEAMARAMHFAHERGIIHRDLKPDNVLLTADGTPKITDFGLAKKIEGGSGVTQTGAIMGTPSYMAPEQADGRTKNVGPAADIYSLGAVLYRLI
ncbi:MAG: serine/threonine protein kinase, partial [Nitrospira sp.]|nr:serine/threonine protein kinase [Nitrospira sp.]